MRRGQPPERGGLKGGHASGGWAARAVADQRPSRSRIPGFLHSM
ncbi:hypothetical protein DB31_7693 [Hyalangium minutum]|uniref:Uncharacterized protein n=1 Tax=Hyalangium minutum TaxID=394096 RepID=A0A085WL93_9BACT|nr:hypothetical protein DB31_7693 [Hyalangium minutum]